MLINLSNHPSTQWSEEQKSAAVLYGETVDLPFPAVDPERDKAYIDALSDEYIQNVQELSQGKDTTIHVMGEMTLTFSLVKKLQTMGFTCIASTSERMVTETEAGQKEVFFRFKRFREYQ
ncbi:hypothetical protein [Parabacteroides sp. Marseille-P3160]|uniref:hypothetical protein n=1 Tax=Parabacteroides sp. Marseille-P3160 TaxID=1917887 RepID=UPI0009BA9A4A|nr:hypothetical protein [Parabacteroides sp. Marseille-P3160]